MSAPSQAAPPGGVTPGKKAVHVKWAGKTIALGTFPAGEADEKCARAKALTRAWRSTMRPKPTREWVMLELERLGVRVVSGRLGRKAGEEEEDAKKAADMARGGPPIDRSNSIGWPSSDADFNSLMQRRNSSLGLGLIGDSDMARRQSLGSLGGVVGLDDPMPPHRPLVGGGAAAAYEAARADHYAQKNAEQQRRASSLGLGIGGGNLGGGGMPNMGFSVNPNQHYEMLKLHHMNLLNEIQETTLMMNLYQQQQLQQQQQQLQQQAGGDQMSGSDPQMALLLQQQAGAASGGASGMDSGMFTVTAQQRGSLGLGASASGNNQQMEQLLRPRQMMQAAGSGGAGSGAGGPSTPSAAQNAELLKGQQEQAALEGRLQKLKEDIARRQQEADGLDTKAGGDKRKADDTAGPAKKAKTEGKDKADEKESKEN